MLFGNRVGEGLTRSTKNPLLPSIFPVKEEIDLRPQDSKSSVARTVFHFGWIIPLTTVQTPSNSALS